MCIRLCRQVSISDTTNSGYETCKLNVNGSIFGRPHIAHVYNQVERPEDREWTEWVHLLKRLATKRRIPARVLYNGQIKQLVTILENSMEMRHAAKHQSRPLKDDRNVRGFQAIRLTMAIKQQRALTDLTLTSRSCSSSVLASRSPRSYGMLRRCSSWTLFTSLPSL